ncbi:hypothetical protein N7524_011737 [Penicillium chrysogenum]|nr:hypothetical protein N7524_011737 [Penicillium chrysogenum]
MEHRLNDQMYELIGTRERRCGCFDLWLRHGPINPIHVGSKLEANMNFQFLLSTPLPPTSCRCGSRSSSCYHERNMMRRIM